MKNLALILGAFAGGVPGNPVYTPAPPMQTTSYLPPVDGDGWNKADTNGYQTGHQSVYRIIDGQLYICNLDNCQYYQPNAFGNNQVNNGGYGVQEPTPVPQIKTTVPDHGLEHEQNSVLDRKSVPDQNPSLNNQNPGQEHGQKTDLDQDLVLKTSKTEPEESSDFEIIDAVVVFDNFNCDLHEIPSVEAAQKKIQKYFFSSDFKFNGLNSIKIIKREGKKVKTEKCGSMIVHYQASVHKSRSQNPGYFHGINQRIGKSFESHGYTDGYNSMFGDDDRFDNFYAFKISDFINRLIDDLRKYEPSKIVKPDDGVAASNGVVEEGEEDTFVLKTKDYSKKELTEDEIKKQKQRGVEYPREEKQILDIYVCSGRKLSDDDSEKEKEIHVCGRPELNNKAIEDLLAVLGEEEFMSKFISIGNKKIATEKAAEMKKVQKNIWKFIEQKAEDKFHFDSDVKEKYNRDLKKMIKDLEILKKKNEDNDFEDSTSEIADAMKSHAELVKKIAKNLEEKKLKAKNLRDQKKAFDGWLLTEGHGPGDNIDHSHDDSESFEENITGNGLNKVHGQYRNPSAYWNPLLFG
jgi:hypothetical protein